MKKAICLILSLIIVFSCCGAVGFSAAENDGADEQTVYLVGDADMDGIITVLDATLIQRALAELEELSGLQKELADVAGSGYDIICATSIQRCLAGLSTDYPVGEVAADENEGVVYEEAVPWFSYYGDIIREEGSLFFSTAYPDVAFVSDKFVINRFSVEFDYEGGLEPIEGDESSVHSYHMATDTYVIFDYDDKIMYFSDYTSMLSYNGAMTYNPFSIVSESDSRFFKMTEKDRYYGGSYAAATYAYDEVPMLRHGSDILIPLQAFSDLFMSVVGYFYQYNGEGVYFVSHSTPEDPDQQEYWEQYCGVEKRETISKELAQVNYYELCNALDARYGLQAAHNIESFDEYFNRKGIKKQMLSGDLKTIERATIMISVLLFEDLHSSPVYSSPFLEETIVREASMFSPLYMNRVNKINSKSVARAEKLGDVEPYERRGDTVFITFDSFTFSGEDAYYAEGFEPDPHGDTVELLAYSLRRLQNEDSDVKNVVIDLACNTGGTVISCGFAMEAICGQCMICLQNPNTWALHQCVYKYDLNLDGVIDENDVSILGMGKNVAINISDSSFSCGNMLPCSIDAIDDRVMLIGQTSGGGACEVGYLSTSTGAIMQISSEYRFVTMKNGYIRDIDSGVAPDVYLTMNRMFDRDYITELVDEQFG